MWNLVAVEDFSQLYTNGGSNMSLLFHHVRMYRTSKGNFQATTDMDRVYALLSFSDRWFMSPAVAAVDYTQPLARLFTNTALHFLTNKTVHPKFRLAFLAHAGLCFAGNGGIESWRTTYLPSWVPDWKAMPLSLPFVGLEGFRELFGNNRHKKHRYCEAIASWNGFGDVGSAYSPLHHELTSTVMNRVEKAQKSFYRAGGQHTMSDEEAQDVLPRVIPSTPVSGTKLDVTGVSVGRLAHLGTPFGSLGAYSLLSQSFDLLEQGCIPSQRLALFIREVRTVSQSPHPRPL